MGKFSYLILDILFTSEKLIHCLIKDKAKKLHGPRLYLWLSASTLIETIMETNYKYALLEITWLIKGDLNELSKPIDE